MARPKVLAALCCIGAFLLANVAALSGTSDDAYRKLVLARQYKQAVVLLTKSAKKGNPLSQYRLAVMLRSGLGIARNDTQARTWLRKSSLAGNKEAKELLRRLSVAVTTEKIDVPAAAQQRSPRVASFDNLPPRQPGEPSWLALASARAFNEVVDMPKIISLANQRDVSGQTPLITAVRSGNAKLVMQMIKWGSDINTVDDRGMSALLWAVESSHQDILLALIDANASTDLRTKAGDNAELLAARVCNMRGLEALQGQLRKQSVNARGETVAHVLVKSCHQIEPNAKFFAPEDVAALDNSGRSPLSYAVVQGDMRMISFLIEQGAVITSADNEGATALHSAANRGHVEAVKLLLKNAADSEALDKGLNTPLMLAAANGHIACLELLLPVAADINQKNADGETVLMLAVKSGKPEAVAQAVAAGGSTTSRSISRDTPEKVVERLGAPLLKAALDN